MKQIDTETKVVRHVEMEVNFKIVDKNGGQIVKKLSLIDGKLSKDASDCWVSSGQVETMSTELSNLPDILEELTQNKALVLSNAEIGKRGLVSRARQGCKQHAVSRTREHMPWVAGPCLLLFETGAELIIPPKPEIEPIKISDKLLFRIQEICDLTSIGKAKIYQLIESGRLSAHNLDGCKVVTAGALGDFIASLPVKRVNCGKRNQPQFNQGDSPRQVIKEGKENA